MDKLFRQPDVPLAKNTIEEAGLCEDIYRLAEISAYAYQVYPFHNRVTKGKYDAVASKLIMKILLKTMTEDAVICEDSEETNGFAVCLPFVSSGNKTVPFFVNGDLKMIL